MAGQDSHLLPHKTRISVPRVAANRRFTADLSLDITPVHSACASLGNFALWLLSTPIVSQGSLSKLSWPNGLGRHAVVLPHSAACHRAVQRLIRGTAEIQASGTGLSANIDREAMHLVDALFLLLFTAALEFICACHSWLVLMSGLRFADDTMIVTGHEEVGTTNSLVCGL